MGYRDTYERWQNDPSGFWMAAAAAIDWFSPPTVAFDPAAGIYGRWFPDATCNTCYNALDRHVAGGRADQAALVYDSPVTGTKRTFSYAELLGEVQALALVLTDLGVERGDRVVVYMPMVPEAVVGMLACARIGAVHSVVFGGFAARELATRIDDATPKVILSASCGIEPGRTVAYKPLLNEALSLAHHRPSACLILQRERLGAELVPDRDHDWSTRRKAALADIRAGCPSPCAELAAADPLYILYTSGTTGRPKGIVRDNGGHMVALRWTMEAIYGMAPSETYWAASDVGWVVGHSYIVYGPLLHGCTTILYEGKPVGTPDAGAFWRVVAEHGVKVLFTAPTAIRAIRKEDPEGLELAGHDLSGFQALFLAGERADPETIRWAERLLGVPVVDHWWQTETGCAVAANPLGLERLPVKHGSPAVPMPGYGIRILDAEGRAVEPGAMGNIALDLPLPPGAAVTLWEADDRFRSSYLLSQPGFYDTADAGSVDEDGYVWVMGRTDDVINVAGHRLSTGAMEEAVAAHPAVAECAVFGCSDELKGEVPFGLVVLKSGVDTPAADIPAQVIAIVRDHIGPVAAFKRVIVVDRLPKTRSGKILRATIKRIVDGEPYAVPGTIEDPTVLADIERIIRAEDGS
ncbi:AMP-binding protein [uncultured Jannaschia sp.]|uniref:AMP-binding protein n=1 Tax=uncultured Jannaschia sp. TaxID=293347 RepID=UPI0026245F86|nr:AMP-binding protein [uncultured Jannaschia sp.]